MSLFFCPLFNIKMANKSQNMHNFEIITLNCQGLRSSDHRDTLFSWLNCSKVDFLCLQETHSISAKEFSSWLKAATEDGLLPASCSCISSPGTNRSSRVAIVYKNIYSLSSCHADQQGRLDPLRSEARASITGEG